MRDNPRPLSSPGNGDAPSDVDPEAVKVAAEHNGSLLRAIPLGWQMLLVVNVPILKRKGTPEGEYAYDLFNLSIAAPQGLPKSLITSIEAAVERWAEGTRQAIDARKIVTL